MWALPFTVHLVGFLILVVWAVSAIDNALRSGRSAADEADLEQRQREADARVREWRRQERRARNGSKR
jgi:hypothetical protein